MSSTITNTPPIVLVEALVEARLLEPLIDHDRRAIETATEKLLAWVIAE